MGLPAFKARGICKEEREERLRAKADKREIRGQEKTAREAPMVLRVG